MVSNFGMSGARLEALLRRSFPDLEVCSTHWLAPVDDGVDLYIVVNEYEDRVRIMIPVAQADRRDADLMWVLLVANYDLARDAKYAIHDGVVWCTFLHQLSWLTGDELDNALCNVITLARNTGTTFSSVDLGIELPGIV